MTARTWSDRLLLTSPLVGVAFLLLFNPADENPTVCPFALCTGMACPGCGMTRAISQLIRGNFGQALIFHPLAPLVFAQVVAGWIWYLLRRRNLVAPMSQRVLNIVLIGSAASLLVVWGVRMLAGALPTV